MPGMNMQTHTPLQNFRTDIVAIKNVVILIGILSTLKNLKGHEYSSFSSCLSEILLQHYLTIATRSVTNDKENL